MSCGLTELITSFIASFVNLLRFSVHDCVTHSSSFLEDTTFILFLTYGTVQGLRDNAGRNGEVEDTPVLSLIIGGSLSPLSILLFSWMPFITLKKFPSTPSLLRVLNNSSILSSDFSVSVDMIICFSLSSPNMMNLIIVFQVLTCLCS